MRAHSLMFIVLSLATCARAGNHGFPVDWRPAGARVDLSGYTLAFHDEFDSTAGLGDATAHTPWVVGRHSVMHGGEAMAAAGDVHAYSARDGVLTLATRYDTYKDRVRYLEADIETRHTFGPNFYAEVRMRGMQVDGGHAGVWMRGEDAGQGHPEVDIVEQYGPGDRFDHSTSHMWPGRKGGRPVYTSSLTPRDEPRGVVGWHTYGLLATDDDYTIYRDGEALKSIARQSSQRSPMYLLLSVFGFRDGAPPVSMKIDYARIYLPLR